MFLDRKDAGRRLAGEVSCMQAEHPLVLGLPRGGVVVAAEIARATDAPLDVLVVRKLGAPGRPECSIGAVVDGDPPTVIVHRTQARLAGADDDYVAAETARQLATAREREACYRGHHPRLERAGRVIVLADDGVATGATVEAAIEALRPHAARIVLVVPVGAPEALDRLRPLVGALVCLEAPAGFRAVSQHYADFTPTTDGEVVALLDEAAVRRHVSDIASR